jgi:hypothetical protein
MVDHVSDYVSNAAWIDPPARADAIDDVADQFERPVGEPAWVGEPALRWPRSSRGWRSRERMHARSLERRLG